MSANHSQHDERHTPSAVIACIALGSNLGEREQTIRTALRRLDEHEEISIVAVSELIETDPVGQSGQERYINAAAVLSTLLTPRALLDYMLEIERQHGRVRDDSTRWGPRTLDLDLLLYGEHIISEPGLMVPHPHLHERDFVLIPLAEIAPNAVHPILGRTIMSLLSDLTGGMR